MTEITNNDRAAWAEIAINNFRNEVMQGEDDDTTIGDLLANILHYCDQYGVDFDARLTTARMHFEAEIIEASFEAEIRLTK